MAATTAVVRGASRPRSSPRPGLKQAHWGRGRDIGQRTFKRRSGIGKPVQQAEAPILVVRRRAGVRRMRGRAAGRGLQCVDAGAASGSARHACSSCARRCGWQLTSWRMASPAASRSVIQACRLCSAPSCMALACRGPGSHHGAQRIRHPCSRPLCCCRCVFRPRPGARLGHSHCCEIWAIKSGLETLRGVSHRRGRCSSGRCRACPDR